MEIKKNLFLKIIHKVNKSTKRFIKVYIPDSNRHDKIAFLYYKTKFLYNLELFRRTFDSDNFIAIWDFVCYPLTIRIPFVPFHIDKYFPQTVG